MSMKRRTLLTGMAATAAATAAGVGMRKGWTQSAPVIGAGKGVQLPYKFYTVGSAGDLYAGERETLGIGDPDEGMTSIIVEVDMMTRQVRYLPYPMSNGHWPLVLPDGRMFITSRFNNKATFLSAAGDVLKKFRLEQFEGFQFGGHSLYDAKYDRIISTVTSPVYGDGANGFVSVTDAKTMELVAMMPVAGTNNSHELCYLPNGDGIVVTGYAKNGDYEEVQDIVAAGWAFNEVDRAVLSVLNPETLEVMRQYPSPNKIAMGHMDVDAQGNVYIEQRRSLSYTPQEQPKKGEDEPEVSRNVMDGLVAGYEKEIGGKRTWNLHPTETAKRGLSTPTAVLKINAYTGKTEELWERPENHRYIQSIAYHPQLDNVYASSRHSDALMVFPANGGKPYSRQTAEFGIYTACGVCAFPGTPYIAVLSNYSGIAIVDATTMQVADYYPIPTFKAIHLNPIRMA